MVRRRNIGLLAGFVSVAVGCGGSKPTAQTAATTPAPSQAYAAPQPAPAYAAVPAPVAPPPSPSNAPAPPAPSQPPPQPPAAGAVAINPQAYVEQAQNELGAGANDVAQETAKKALQIDSRNAPAMVVIAQAEYNEGKIDLARYALDQALVIDPQDADANNLYGFIDPTRQDLASDQEKVAAALKHFKAATNARPDFAAAWNNLGATYLKAKRYDDARAALERVVQLRPNWAIAQMNLGCAYRAQGLLTTDPSMRDQLLQGAEQRLQLAGKLDPSNAEVHFNLGTLYLDADPFPGMNKLDRLQKAIDEITQYQQLEGPRLAADDPTQAPDGGYLADARAQYDHEQKEEQRRAKKRAKEQQQPAQQPPPAAQPAAGGAPNGG